MYWPLRSFLPVPHRWATRLTVADNGDLAHRARISTDAEVVEGITDGDLIGQACFLHLPATHVHDALAWKVVNQFRLPHSSEEHVGGPNLDTGGFYTIDLHPTHLDATGPGASAATTDRQVADDDNGDDNDHGDDGEDDGEDDGSPSSLTHTTVVFASVALQPTPGHIDVAAAVGQVEDLVQTTTRALHAVTGMGYQLPTLTAATLEVLVGLDEIVAGALEPRWNVGHYTAQGLTFALRDVADDNIADALAHAELEATQHTFRSLISDLQRQAVAADRRQGDTRTAVVMAAATCEAWVDLIAGALLWEEGATPEDAAERLAVHRTMRDRLHQLLAPRLGGAWNIKAVPALRAWDDDVRKARNRVLHAGGLPSTALAERSINAMYGLLSLTLDRLCNPRVRNRYPVAAVLLANRVGLEARNGWTRRIRDAASEADRDDLGGAFNRWYSATTQLVLTPAKRRTPRDTQLQMVALTDGRTYWIERDPTAGVARLASLSTSDARRLEEHRPDTSAGQGMTVSFDIEIPYRPVGDWVAEHNLVPGAAVMRDVSTWQHPPAAPAADQAEVTTEGTTPPGVFPALATRIARLPRSQHIVALANRLRRTLRG